MLASVLKTVRVPEKFAPLFEQAQQYVQRYFAEQRLQPERGTLEICGQRYVLVRAASMSVEFYEMVKSLYGEEQEALAVTHSLLFDIAHAMGLADSKVFAERMHVSDPVARLSAGPIHFAHAGWAFVDISPESNPTPGDDYFLLYDHPYSFESDSWVNAGKSSDSPVCVMSAGYSSGWCEHSFGVPLVAVEILCRAKGDDVCRFIMTPPDRIEDRITRYARENPDLAPRITGYKIPGFFAKRTDTQLLRTNLELERRVQQRARELSVMNAELKRDIAERERAEAALGASMELNERLIEALPGGVVHVAKDGSIVRANPDACRILGLSYDELTRRFVADFDSVTIYEDGSPARAEDYPVSRAFATGEPQPAMTLGIRRPNGEIAWAVFRAVPLKDHATQETIGAVVTFFDITERKRFEDKLRHTQKLESLGVLAGGIAHDFNNLLVTILGNASYGKGLVGVDPRMVELLDEIEIGAKRAAELTKQMLDYSGQGRFKLERLDLPAVVREMTQLVKALIPKHVDLHYRFKEGLPPINADATQLRQVIMNLVTNAAESIDEDGGRVVISIDERLVTQQDLDEFVDPAAQPGRFLCLEVADSGSGMDEETRSRVFDPFFTTKFKGRGLGMAAVLGIVRGHGGTIHVDSREGEGTSVCVLLPAHGQTTSERARQSARVSSGTVLVVDDDNGVQWVARRVLTDKGYRVLLASNGLEGVRVFEQNADAIDVIVMDVTMPQLGGIEALRRIRATGSRVPVLLSSGYGADSAGSEVGELAGFLEKPYSVDELLDAVAKALHWAG